MKAGRLPHVVFLCGLMAGLLAVSAVRSAETADATQTGTSNPKLSDRQTAEAAKYAQFEKSLLQLYEYMKRTDPDRADLLERAYRQSRETQLTIQMRQLVQLLQQEEYGDAVVEQEQLLTHLGSLLDLLQSEDRMSELEREKQRIEALLRDVNRTIGREKVIRAATDRGDDADRLANRQKDVADQTQGIVDKINQHDSKSEGGQSQSGKPSESGKDSQQPSGENESGKPGEQGDSKSGEQKPGEKKPGEEKAGEKKAGEEQSGEQKAGEQKPGEQDAESKSGQPQSESEGQPGQKSESGEESKPGKSGKPGQQSQPPQPGDPSERKSSKGAQQDGGDKQSQTPGREQLEQAHREMERAIEELKKKNRDGASQAEDEALEQLIAAKQKLEEILRQLREEERALVLAALEARFQKMLNMQIIVLNGTVNLDKTPEDQRDGSGFVGRSRELARMEDEIALEADKALAILKAEGTSVAFPIAVEDLSADVRTVVGRLETAEVGELTQAIERDIVEALAEMVEALQKEMEKDKKEGQPCDCEGEPVLVDKLAELKMLRTLQKRVNRRTRTLGRLIDGEQAQDPDLLGQLQELARRQNRIVKTAYDISSSRD